MITLDVVKGSRIKANWLKAHITCLAGVQMKLGATSEEVVGIVRHIRTDNLEDPKEIRFFIDPEGDFKGARVNVIGCTCGHPHIEIRPEWVTEVLT